MGDSLAEFGLMAILKHVLGHSRDALLVVNGDRIQVDRQMPGLVFVGNH
jgi:hypothetical protein